MGQKSKGGRERGWDREKGRGEGDREERGKDSRRERQRQTEILW